MPPQESWEQQVNDVLRGPAESIAQWAASGVAQGTFVVSRVWDNEYTLTAATPSDTTDASGNTVSVVPNLYEGSAEVSDGPVPPPFLEPNQGMITIGIEGSNPYGPGGKVQFICVNQSDSASQSQPGVAAEISSPGNSRRQGLGNGYAQN